MNGERTYRAADGREWVVTLESPGSVLRVPPELERSGALLPEHEVRIVFASGDERISEEYTGMALLEDLGEEELGEWYAAARRARGL